MEPPENIKSFFKEAETKAFIDDDAYMKIATEMMDFHAEDLSTIGTIAYMKYPTLVNTKLGNVDALTVYGFSHASDGTKSHRPEVFYWKE